jgi:deoxyadenosine/deoxycytidine kinase
MNKKPIVIAVEGIVGVGKTTIIERCLESLLTKKGYRVKIIKEPVDQWTEILPLFYSDPKRYAYHMQTFAFLTRVKEGKNVWTEFKDTVDIFITERSILSDTFFVETLYKEGNFTDLEYKHYYEWWKMWEQLLPFKTDLYIYLTPSMKETMKRVKIRARPGEEGVSEEYQLHLKAEHDKVLDNEYVGNVPILRLNTDLDFINDDNVKQNIVNQIEERIKKL